MMRGAKPGLMRIWPLYNVYANVVQAGSLGSIICIWLIFLALKLGW